MKITTLENKTLNIEVVPSSIFMLGRIDTARLEYAVHIDHKQEEALETEAQKQNADLYCDSNGQNYQLFHNQNNGVLLPVKLV